MSKLEKSLIYIHTYLYVYTYTQHLRGVFLGSSANRKSVNTIKIRFNLTRFRKNFSVCTHIQYMYIYICIIYVYIHSIAGGDLLGSSAMQQRTDGLARGQGDRHRQKGLSGSGQNTEEAQQKHKLFTYKTQTGSNSIFFIEVHIFVEIDSKFWYLFSLLLQLQAYQIFI